MENKIDSIFLQFIEHLYGLWCKNSNHFYKIKHFTAPKICLQHNYPGVVYYRTNAQKCMRQLYIPHIRFSNTW